MNMKKIILSLSFIALGSTAFFAQSPDDLLNMVAEKPKKELQQQHLKLRV
jgi:hypothetical protein